MAGCVGDNGGVEERGRRGDSIAAVRLVVDVTRAGPGRKKCSVSDCGKCWCADCAVLCTCDLEEGAATPATTGGEGAPHRATRGNMTNVGKDSFAKFSDSICEH